MHLPRLPRNPESHPLSDSATPSAHNNGSSPNGEQRAMALVELSHTPAEHSIYRLMLDQVRSAGTCMGSFDLRKLMTAANIGSYSSTRRAIAGLIDKLSIEFWRIAGDNSHNGNRGVYMVYGPADVIERRQAAGIEPLPRTIFEMADRSSFCAAIEKVVEQSSLSRREAQVALFCAEGMTNAEIGTKLFISEQTVKFHLRHIFVKLGVRRRAELVSRLLASDSTERSYGTPVRT